MATARPPKVARPRFNEDDFPLWKSSFSEQLRRQLIEEDLLAGRSVSGVLIAIVAMGLLIGLLAVYFCL